MTITPHTKPFAVIGNPIRHSISPQIHNFLFNAINYDAVYTAYEVKDENFVGDIAFLSRHFSGFNITIPYKQNIIPYLTEIDEKAKMYGSVNTAKCVDGKLHGYSTDGDGMMRALEYHGIDIVNKKVLLTGSGGVSRVMAHEAAMAGATVTIAVRESGAGYARELAETVKEHIKGSEVSWCTIDQLTGSFDVLLQGTPVGMSPNKEVSPLPEKVYANIPQMMDAIYNPTETMLMREMRKHKAKAANGLMMLLFQGVRSQEIWTGNTYSREIIDKLTGMVEGMIREE